jgi:sterol 14-demethylase
MLYFFPAMWSVLSVKSLGQASLVALFVSLIVCLLWWARNQGSPSRQRIPRPRIGIPIIGDALSFVKNLSSYICQATARCGPIFQTDLLMTKIVTLRGPSLDRFYLDVREETWSFGDGMVSQSSFPY